MVCVKEVEVSIMQESELCEAHRRVLPQEVRAHAELKLSP